MNLKLVRRLLLYIIDKLQDLDAPISTIRLVKYLYILDMEYFGRHGETLTGLNWIRYYYGPYSFEFPEIISSLGIDIEVEEYPTDQGMGRTFRSLGEQRIDDVLDFSTNALLDRIIEHWSHENLDLLLDYVYSSGALRDKKLHENLDFSGSKKHYGNISINYLKVENEKAKEIRERLTTLRKNAKRSELLNLYDELYFQEIDKLNYEDEFSGVIIGKIALSEDAAQTPIQEMD